MVRNIVILGGSSHPALTEAVCTHLGIPPAKIHLSKFSVGETRVEIGDSVREKDVFIIQSGGGKVNDHLMELLITISACKTASAKKVTAVLPLFPYSRQSDLPYNKAGAPLARMPTRVEDREKGGAQYAFDSRPATPGPGKAESPGIGGSGVNGLSSRLNGLSVGHKAGVNGHADPRAPVPKRKDTLDSNQSDASYLDGNDNHFQAPTSNPTNTSMTSTGLQNTSPPDFAPRRGYRQWVAQAGTLVADLLTCAGADHIITMDLHDPQYQGFFDIPVDNLYGRHLLRKYIQHHILPKHGGMENCVIVSPDAGGAKRATNIADALGMGFALIHKERRPNQPSAPQAQTPTQNATKNASMLLVGDVAGRTAILIDDLADTSNTITRAAKLLKRSGASTVYALVTHGVFSGDAIERIYWSGVDKCVATNSVPQDGHVARMVELEKEHGMRGGNLEGSKLEVLEVGHVFAEAIRRVHHGESISVLFQYD
ncbi:ribose-phosphate pyrophosphokinase [Elasticomyces elasticus]|uniref:ribose-phosphate diphosphokinase n=1 Tax=Elasticomyces elasticus TaxID=574655 RepID=A0AAN7ZLL5_9PEZI|nr:ribose-phosphate pyrophosphokinase [Elasticomyces elasticus]